MSSPDTNWGIDPAVPGYDGSAYTVWQIVMSDSTPIASMTDLKVLKNRCPQGCLYPKEEVEEL